MKTLNEIYSNHSFKEGHGDKGTIHTYIEEYELLLEKYRNDITFLEIGVFYGESLEMWSEYFTNSRIYGVDINNHYNKHLENDERFKIIISDATKFEIMNHFPKPIQFDVIIDDGSHRLEDQIITFNILKPHMKPGGLYIIEDINNIDQSKNVFTSLFDNCRIIDNRHKKNRFDDVLVIYQF